MRKFLLIVLLLTGQITLAKQSVLTTGKGYLGTLPVLTREYNESNEHKTSKPEIKPSKEFNSENELKPIPREDPTFANIILKKDKTTQYETDLAEFIPVLENLITLIENESNVQFFNAKVYYFNKNAEYFRDKYQNRTEAQYVSYKKLVELSNRAKAIAVLRLEAQKFNPLLASGDPNYIYNPNNISTQVNFLKDEIVQTLTVLKETE